jgi:propanol-preferring alcohol dehydrogenase
MLACWVTEPGPARSGLPLPVEVGDRPVPLPGPGQVRVKVRVCGVCRTDLHLAEGDLLPRHRHVTPGHEVVGEIDLLGEGCRRLYKGQRVGIAWLAATCGACRFCSSGRENLCLTPRYTGWDVDGGFAEYATAEEAYVYEIPDGFEDEEAAPLLCAGIIGYRALRRCDLPPGGRLGIYGFGASAHLTIQVALAAGAEVHVMTRSPEAQRLALALGASSAAGATDPPPRPLDGAILFAPVGDLVPVALEALDRAGKLAVAGIHLTDIPVLNYQRHLFQEREIRSVTANTRQDGREFLAIAQRIGLRPTTTPYSLEQAGQALIDLAADRVNGAAVIRVAD